MSFNNHIKQNIIWSLEGILLSGKTWFIPINRIPFVIGRNKDCHLTLSSNTVSRYHAEIIQEKDYLLLRDLDSANGTYVNNKRIMEQTRIKEGDIIHFDELEFRVTLKKITDFTSAKETQKGMDSINKSLPRHFVNCEHEFHEMLSQEAVVPYYQPIVTLHNTSVVGYEILGRCYFEGLPSNPGELFKIAANLGYEIQLSELLRREGVRIGDEFPEEKIFFYNTHENEVSQTHLIASLREIRKAYPLRAMVLEIHEKAVTDIDHMKHIKSILSELNIGLAYDDFGAGQSRLIELCEVPPDYLKFDISLIRNIHTACQRKQEIVKRLVKIVDDFGICALAEGIESKKELDTCIQMGFNHAQGYYFGKPTSIDSYRNTFLKA